VSGDVVARDPIRGLSAAASDAMRPSEETQTEPSSDGRGPKKTTRTP
jgi:hypothetical protein